MGQELELELTAMAYGGEALGRDQAGRVVFVPYALPGERLRVEVVEAKRAFVRARPLALLSRSEHRVTPRCPHFGPRHTPVSANPREGYARGCGGCQWQHIAYEAQLQFKREIVREQFARIGKMPDAPVAPMLPSREWNYRNQMRFAVDQSSRLCLQALESHALIPIRECHIMAPPLVALFNSLDLSADYDAVTLRAGENTGDRMIVFEASEAAAPEIETDEPVSIVLQTAGKTVTLIGKENIEERVRGSTYQISPESFFQVNTPQAEVLLNLVQEFLAPRSDEVLLDAYSGVGLFGLALAAGVAKVIEVEENPSAVADARANGRELSNVEFYEGRVEQVLPTLQAGIDAAIVDPPRAGMERTALAALVTVGPRVIVYVSCDPATLARDAARLGEAGYRITAIQPVDLFPQTYHVECVVRLERK